MKNNNNQRIGVVKTVSFDGVEVFETIVECHLLPGIPSFIIVGLGDKTINESKERVKSALFSSGFSIPSAKIIVNLSPANRYKEGSHYDLPIALAILIAIGELKQNYLNNYIIMGELSLSGSILAVNGVLPSVIFCKNNNLSFICGKYNEQEMILDINYKSSDNLIDLVNNIKNNISFNPNIIDSTNEPNDSIFNNIYGQKIGKRAILIAAAGKHNLMFIGSKGVGKSMLSKSILDLIPNLTEKESLETTSIHSIAGVLNNHKLIKKPPFRSPHTSSSLVSLIGGGTIPKPGEISLAHNGILFLDELPEFNSSVIDSLRTPIEEGVVHISRSKYKISYPCNFQLIVSMNPCKCGNLLTGVCKCNQKNYMYKVSGPIQDRIDIKVILEKVDFNEKTDNVEVFRELIKKSIDLQINRFGNYNSKINVKILENNGNFENESIEILKKSIINKNMSGRAYFKTLSIARTIADLEESYYVKKEHINEALFFSSDF